jgi:hypothetical protein
VIASSMHGIRLKETLSSLLPLLLYVLDFGGEDEVASSLLL